MAGSWTEERRDDKEEARMDPAGQQAWQVPAARTTNSPCGAHPAPKIDDGGTAKAKNSRSFSFSLPELGTSSDIVTTRLPLSLALGARARRARTKNQSGGRTAALPPEPPTPSIGPSVARPFTLRRRRSCVPSGETRHADAYVRSYTYELLHVRLQVRT